MLSEKLPAEILGVSAAAADIRDFVEEAAKSVVPVLLGGEPGTGKQLAAQSVHEKSSRRKGPILMIDCALYYERELNRELFGYGGPGTVCKERKGILEFSNRGTCYFSHIEEVTPALQDRLLRFLTAGCFRRLGDGKEIRSDARLIVSSDKNLEGFVHAGLFNEDFFAAIAGQYLFFPPLRERKEDIPLMAEALTASYAGELSTKPPAVFSPESFEALQCYPWPLNVDELIKEISRLLESGLREIHTDHLAMEISSYWLGQRGDPETRKVLEELDAYIREFRILSRIGCEFGDPTVVGSAWKEGSMEPERDLLEEY